MTLVLEYDCIRQAVWLGSEQVSTAHMLLTALALDEQLASARAHLSAEVASFNRGGEALAAVGVTSSDLLHALVGDPVAGETSVPAATRRRWRGPPARWLRRNPSGPPWAVSAYNAAEQAMIDASSEGTSNGTSYMVRAALADERGSACVLLRHLGIAPSTVLNHLARPPVTHHT